MFFANPKRSAPKAKTGKPSPAQLRAAATDSAKKQADSESSLNAKEQYRRVRQRAMYERFSGTNQEFDEAVRTELRRGGVLIPIPEQWVVAAKGLACPCRRCASTGQFITSMVNGKPTGPGGICYRCEGKGFQTDADARRNYYYDLYRAESEARGMV